MQNRTKQDIIADYIREMIDSGAWKPGHKLPSQTQWREEFGYKYGPLRSAYLVLRALGYIEGLQGDGVYVRDRSADK